MNKHKMIAVALVAAAFTSGLQSCSNEENDLQSAAIVEAAPDAKKAQEAEVAAFQEAWIKMLKEKRNAESKKADTSLHAAYWDELALEAEKFLSANGVAASELQGQSAAEICSRAISLLAEKTKFNPNN